MGEALLDAQPALLRDAHLLDLYDDVFACVDEALRFPGVFLPSREPVGEILEHLVPPLVTGPDARFLRAGIELAVGRQGREPRLEVVAEKGVEAPPYKVDVLLRHGLL